MGSTNKHKKKNIPRSINEMSKEKLEETLIKKKECNAKAQKIVEMLCEPNVEEVWLLENLQFINQCHFEDVTVERSLSRLCGYPLCNKTIENVLKQQYHISTRYNKVFDITERKNFCSASCYKSSCYLKNQLFTSPLWFRDQEVIPKYSILKSQKSSMGEEVVLLPQKIVPQPEDVNTNTDKKVTKSSVNINELGNQYSKLSLSEESTKFNNLSQKTELLENLQEDSNTKCEDDTKACEEVVKQGSSVVKEKSCDNKTNIKLTDKNNIVLNSDTTVSPEILSNVGSISDTNVDSENTQNISRLNKKINFKNYTDKALSANMNFSNVKSIKKMKDDVDSVVKVENSILEWFSVDSLLYLFGDKKLKELFKDKAEEIKVALNSKLTLANYDEKIERMIKLYGLLETESFTANKINSNLKPLPDYSSLQEEGKMLEVKVRAYYQGQLEIKKPLVEKKIMENEEVEQDNVCLPLVDAHAQKALRRKIVLEKLNKLLPDIVRVFSTEYHLEMSEIRKFVSTFTLTAHNITFKPIEWNLVGLILIKLFSIKDKYLDIMLKLEDSQDQLKSLLHNYNLPSNYLKNFVKRLTEKENLLNNLI